MSFELLMRDCAAEEDRRSKRDELMQRLPIRFTRVSVLRHAESDGNVTPRYQGKVPGTDLTGKGRKQAAEAGTHLGDGGLEGGEAGAEVVVG